jgi:malate dehydrogenase (oxaloacetate-decarboxylating)(NADP+)
MSDSTSQISTPEDKLPSCAARGEYHELRCRQISIAATKQMVNQRDLALAFAGRRRRARRSSRTRSTPSGTARQPRGGHHERHAVLGLGDIGPLASKPVMQARASCRAFADADVFDIEIDEGPASWPR